MTAPLPRLAASVKTAIALSGAMAVFFYSLAGKG